MASSPKVRGTDPAAQVSGVLSKDNAKASVTPATLDGVEDQAKKLEK